MSLHAAAARAAPGEEIDMVETWRSIGEDRPLWMRGVTTSYRFEPAGQYVVGVASVRGYRLRRGRAVRVVAPGDLVVLDPALTHQGSPAADGPWVGHLVLLDALDLRAILGSDDGPVDVAFPDPVVGDVALTRRFLALHHASSRPASDLERQTMLHLFLADLAVASAASRQARLIRDNPAVRRAVDHLRSTLSLNVSLDELAALAGTDKYRLVRQFTAAVGVPPHAYQIALRVDLARRLLERGEPPAKVATEVGFFDQSHLHRHFRRRLGITPAQYARRPPG
jgi:AraC-like DNA-binding protein